jgi:glycosyltransferase involved in cell wall biosynthesis
MNNSLTIAVVIPAYNVSSYIERAIKSVLAQTHQPDEFFVVDDGSSDETANIIRKYGNRLTYIYQDNQGLSGARNTGIKRAKSEWIAFLDGDDDWPVSMLQNVHSLLKRHRELVWSTGNYHRCSLTTGKSQIHISPKRIKAVLGQNEYHPDYYAALMSDTHGHVNATVIKKRVFDEVGFFDTSLGRHEDLDMFLRIALHYPAIGFVAASQVNYYIDRPGSLLNISAPVQHYIQLISQQLRYADECQQRKKFEPITRYLLRGWLRSFLFSGHGHYVRTLLKEFGFLLSAPYKFSMWMLTIWPGITSACLKGVSRIIRALSLKPTIKR